jgi:uncharacterized membrane protein
MVMLAACVTAAAHGAAGQTRTLVYECQNLSRVVVRIGVESVEVSLPGEAPAVLPLVDSHPVRYANASMTISGLEEYVRIDGPPGHLVCRSAPSEVPWEEARARGVEFRALGGSPEWTLEIDDGVRAEFVADRGTVHVVGVPITERTVDDRRMVASVRTAGSTLRIVMERRICMNAAGVTTTAATITLDGRTFTGCGRVLLPGVLTGTVACRGIKVPDGTQLRVQIVRAAESSRGTSVLAETSTVVHGDGPFAFAIPYDVFRVFGDDRYRVRAAISVNHSRKRWVTSVAPFVVTWGNFASVDLFVTKRGIH